MGVECWRSKLSLCPETKEIVSAHIRVSYNALSVRHISKINQLRRKYFSFFPSNSCLPHVTITHQNNRKELFAELFDGDLFTTPIVKSKAIAVAFRTRQANTLPDLVT